MVADGSGLEGAEKAEYWRQTTFTPTTVTSQWGGRNEFSMGNEGVGLGA